MNKPNGSIPKNGILVFFDTEFTSWPGFLESGFNQPGRYTEIIQIAAVKIDVSNDFSEIDQLDVYVAPSINADLSAYIVDLTGITQGKIDRDGVTFLESLRAFQDFIGEDTEALISYGYDGDVIRTNCDLYGLPHPSGLPPEYDLKQIFMEKGLVRWEMMSGELAPSLGIDVEGRVHNGLHDSRSLVAALRHYINTGQI